MIARRQWLWSFETLTSGPPDTLNNLADIASDHSDEFVALIGRDELGIQCNQACAAFVQSTMVFAGSVGSPAAMPQFNNWAQAQNTRTT